MASGRSSDSTTGLSTGENSTPASMQAAYNSKSNEILLFHNNKLLLKAERGVTLGLIKLIYSSDDENNGIILGVKPRLDSQVPCLVTFESTSLSHDAYDLIIKDFRSGSNTSNESSPEKQSSSYLQHFSVGGTTNRQALPEPLAAATECQDVEFTANIEESNSFDDHSTDESLEIPGADNMLESSTTNGSFNSGELHNVSQMELNLSEGENSPEEDDGKNDPEEEIENEESFQFKPEDFDFDISSVTPTKTDKGLRWPCHRCGKDYCSSSHLKRHWILHTDFKPYKCSLCAKRFPFHWDLKRHMTKHTGNKRYKCPHCTKSFNTQKELKCHNWLHTGRKEYKCEICHHEISSSSNLKIHMRKHTGEKPYKCEYCPKAFYMLGHYQYHVRRHTGEKPYKCDVCGMAFSYSLNLNEHKNIHTGVKPYSCPTCDKRFTHRSTMKQHVLTHSGLRPYKCHLCPKTFIQSSNYRNHLITHKDKQDRAQKCDLCGKELLSRRGVQKHRQRCAQTLIDRANGVNNKKKKRNSNTKERYECGICSKLFTYRANYEAHCKMPHPIAKKRKQRKAKSPKQLAKTGDSTNANKVTCPICGKQFLYVKCIKRHLQKRHSGVEIGTSTPNTATCTGDIVNSTLPTVHIQPAGPLSSSNVTFIFVPSSSAQGSSTTKSTKPKSRQSKVTEAEKNTTESTRPDSQENSAVVSDSAVSRYSLVSDKTSKGDETGSQAITALKILSAKIGIEDQFQALSSRTDEQRPPISKHLTALEQLSKRVGEADEIAVTIETASEPKEQLTGDSTAKDQVDSQCAHETQTKVNSVQDN